MNELVKKAIETLQESEKAVSNIFKEFSEKHTPEGFDDLNAMYEMVTELKVLVSQYSDEEGEKQGNPIVYNPYAMVEIAGIEITGNIQFELMIDGEWICGHRENSPYGQVFMNSKRTVIISEDYPARVHLPLELDRNYEENEIFNSAGTCTPVGTCAPTATCAPTGSCAPAGTCTPTGSCTPAGTCAPVGNCAPAASCAPAGACTPTGTCVPTGACAPIGSCAPAGSCAPTGSCTQVGSCAPVGTCGWKVC